MKSRKPRRFFRNARNLSLLAILFTLAGCLAKDDPSRELVEYQTANPAVASMSQVRFVSDSLGSLSLGGLMSTNILPLKIYGTALLMMDQTETGAPLRGDRLPQVMRKFGFLTPDKIENWRHDWAPEPKINTNLGFLHADLERTILGKKYKVEVANITCAACHSGTTYDANGNPTGRAWLGSPNSSLNFDGFLNSIYLGLKEGLKDQKAFMAKIREAYPDMDPLEARTIEKELLPTAAKEMKKLAKMDRVLPFPNGGPGITNGVGAFKRDAKLLSDPNTYNPHEVGFVSIPDISYRGFRSNLTYDGAYVFPGRERFREIKADEARDEGHLAELAAQASFFTFSAMGNLLENIEPNIPKVQEIFGFLKELKAPPFPGRIDLVIAQQGAWVYAKHCSSCHGTYTPDLVEKPRLVSFPNRFTPQNEMGTDLWRWWNVDESIQRFSRTTVFAKYVDAGKKMGGYVAPILSGLWATAPYLHNGSVPTLWHLLHPSERPNRFEYGGHALDFKKVGIRGFMNASGVYAYPPDSKPWASKAVYDVTEPGRSNKGHESEFEVLTEGEKSALLEYLKLL